MRYVECVYRLTAKGEAQSGIFDLDHDRIDAMPNIYEIPVKANYKFYEESYCSREQISTEELYIEMFKNPGTLAVLNYNNIGFVLVYSDAMLLDIIANRDCAKPRVDIKNPYKVDQLVDLGLCKSVLKTRKCNQPVEHIIGYIENGAIHTYSGGREYTLDETLCLGENIDLRVYGKACIDPDMRIYGVGKIGEETVRLYKMNNYIIARKPD